MNQYIRLNSTNRGAGETMTPYFEFPRGFIIKAKSTTVSNQTRIPLIQCELTNKGGEFIYGDSGDAIGDFLDATDTNLDLTNDVYVPGPSKIRLWGTNDYSWLEVEAY